MFSSFISIQCTGISPESLECLNFFDEFSKRYNSKNKNNQLNFTKILANENELLTEQFGESIIKVQKALNGLNDKYIIAKVYENSSLKLKANPSISIIPPLKKFIIQVSTSNHLIEDNPPIKFQVICVPTEENILDHQKLKQVYNSIDYKKIGQKINIEGKYNEVKESISTSFNEKTLSNLSNVESQSSNDFESLKKKNEEIEEKIDEIKKKIQESKEKLKELYSKSVGLNEENKEKKENKNNVNTFYRLLKNKYSEFFTLIAVLFAFILGASINRLK